jgi:hypothetical protein
MLPDDEIEIWLAMGQDLEQRAGDIGGARLLDWLEDTASHALQIGARERVEVPDAQKVVDELYRRHIGSLGSLPSRSSVTFAARANK